MGVNVHAAKTQVAASSPALFSAPTADAGNNTNVILLGWDGVQRNHLFELMNAGLMPNLSAFIQTGKIVNVTVSDHYTDTKAGWTQVLTGYKWWKTGVFDNSIWFNKVPRNYTIPERLENYYGSNNIATAFITGKLNQMEIEDLTGTAANTSLFAVYSHEALYSNLPSQLDVVNVGDLAEDRYADVVGPLTLQFLENNVNKHFFGFFHFSDPDHIGHQFGENSQEYSNAIETCDQWLGQILGKLNTLGIAQKTLIYITADHGFDEGGFSHQNAPYIFLATNDNNVNRNGDEVDVAPAVYYGLGLWNLSFSPALDGYPLQVSLPLAEVQHRQAVLDDTSNLPSPSITIADTGEDQKTVNFSAADGNLAVVLLTVDNTLQRNVVLTWNYARPITASGSYIISTAGLKSGLHTVKVLAFDEHGANNGAPGTTPDMGGGPSISSVSFTLGTEVTPTPLPTHLPAPSATPTLSPTPKPSTSPTPTPTETIAPTSEPKQDANLDLAIYAAAIAIVVVAFGVYTYSKLKVKSRKS